MRTQLKDKQCHHIHSTDKTPELIPQEFPVSLFAYPSTRHFQTQLTLEPRLCALPHSDPEKMTRHTPQQAARAKAIRHAQDTQQSTKQGTVLIHLPVGPQHIDNPQQHNLTTRMADHVSIPL